MKISRKQKGITLFETLIYLAIFGLIFTGIMQFGLQIAETNRMNSYRHQLERQAIFISQHLQQSFAESGSIDVAGSTFKNDNGILNLNTFSGDDIIYTLADGQIMVERTGSDSVAITSNTEVTVGTFYLNEVLNKDDNHVGVRWTIEMVSVKEPNLTKTIQSTNVLP